MAAYVTASFPRQWSGKTVSRSITPARALIPRKLPPRPACFGRESQLSDIVSILDQVSPPVVVIYGAGGIGKSTVALVTLEQELMKARYGSLRIWIDCSTALPGLEGFLDLIFVALGHKPSAEPNQTINRLFSALEKASGPMRPLMVLDHFESIWDQIGSREEIKDALNALSESISLLITSKHQDFPVLERGYKPFELRQLDALSARATFLHWRPQFEGVGKELDKFLSELDHYPLAIRLVALASAASDRDVRRLRIRWREEQARWAKREDGQASALDLAISYSLHSKLLTHTDHAQKRLEVLQMIAAVPDGLSMETMKDLLEADEVNLQKAIDGGLLTSLVFEDHAHRLRMLSPIREYIRSRYPLSTQQRGELHDYYLCYLESRSLETELAYENEPNLLELMKEESNLDFVISDALRSKSEETCLRSIWMICYGPISYSSEVIKLAAERAGQLSEHPLQIDCLRHLVAIRTNNLKSQYKHLEAAVDVFHQVGTQSLDQAECMEQFGDVLFSLKWPTSAKTEYIGAIEIFESLGERSRVGSILTKLGQLHFHLIPDLNLSESLRYFNAALAIQRDLGDHTTECESFVAISECYGKLENFDASLAHLDRAILLSKTVHESPCAEQFGLTVRRLRIMRLKRDFRSTETYVKACLESFRSLNLSLVEKGRFLNELGHLALAKASDREPNRLEAIILWDCADFLTDYSLFEPPTPAEVDMSDLMALKLFISSHGGLWSSMAPSRVSSDHVSWLAWVSRFPSQISEEEEDSTQASEKSDFNESTSWYQRWLRACIGWHSVHQRFGNAEPWWEVCKSKVRLQLYQARLAKEKGQSEEAFRIFKLASQTLGGGTNCKIFGGGLSEYYPEDERIKCEVMAEICKGTQSR